MDGTSVNGFSYTAGDQKASSILGPDGKPYDYGGQRFRDGMPIPHPITFQGVVGSIRTYRTTWDEALRHNRTNAVAMRRDCFLMGLLRERQLPTARMKWHLEPDDPKDPEQKAVADEVTKIIRAIPHLQKLQMALLEAIWYGRYGAQFIWGRKRIAGTDRKTIIAHEPVNGDKIQYTFDGLPGILVHTAYAKEIKDAVLERTDRGPMLVLYNDYWRQRFAIHTHEIHDADYLEPELAGGIHGVGVRSLIYWCWWLEAEVTTWILDFFERVGQGVQVFYYESGNPDSEAAAYKAAEQQSRSNVIVWPRPAGSERQGAGVEWIQPGMSGADFLLEIVREHFDARMERLIIGQTLSSKAESTGLGSSVADLHADTKFKVIAFDADNLAETLTTDVVRPIKAWNFPDADFELRWVYDLEHPQSDARLAAARQAFDMGAQLKEAEVMALAGLSVPTADDRILQIASGAGGIPGAGSADTAKRDEQGHFSHNQTLVRDPEQAPAREPDEAEEFVRTGQPVRYGRWITIGGHPESGEQHAGGTHVYIENGRITKGHPSLEGKSIAALSENAGTHAHARQGGLDSKQLRQLAADMLEHDRAFKAGSSQEHMSEEEAVELAAAHLLEEKHAGSEKGSGISPDKLAAAIKTQTTAANNGRIPLAALRDELGVSDQELRAAIEKAETEGSLYWNDSPGKSYVWLRQAKQGAIGKQQGESAKQPGKPVVDKAMTRDEIEKLDTAKQVALRDALGEKQPHEMTFAEFATAAQHPLGRAASKFEQNWASMLQRVHFGTLKPSLEEMYAAVLEDARKRGWATAPGQGAAK